MAKRLGTTEEALAAELEADRLRLFAARARRTPPRTDDKVLADGNGLMNAALARGARVLGDAWYALAAFAENHAALIGGLIELYETRFEPADLAAAIALQRALDQRFWQAGHGSYSQVGPDADAPGGRVPDAQDDARPSANSLALANLTMLARLTGNATYAERADQLARAFAGAATRHPSSYVALLDATGLASADAGEVVIVGRPGAADTQAMV